MRVISGKYKRRKLYAGKDLTVRPLMDIVKEFLFNILNDEVDGAKVLDLFSGSGSFGIEAISRGAMQTTMVDESATSIKIAERNMADLKITEVYRIIRNDVFRFLENSDQKFDIVFADPPYQFEKFPELFEKIGSGNVLTEDGVFIIEHHLKVQLPETFGTFERVREKKFGKTLITIYRVKNEN